MQNPKKLSTNSLYECLHLLNEIDGQINNRFLHVTEFISPAIMKAVNNDRNKVLAEIERRENEDEL